MIKANTKIIPESVTIHPTAEIVCDYFEIGENSYIGENTKITCKKFKAGDYLYMTSNVEVGRGGCTGPNSKVIIGNNVGIFEGTVINPSERIEIGDNVGIGAECLIWTHGAWLDITKGFPADFGPVSIGNNVWFPARSIMMPNTSIGDNCVIGTQSIITRDIPAGSLAMGSPCKVIKENYYPEDKNSMDMKLDAMVGEILNVWFNELLPHKGITDNVDVWFDNPIIYLRTENNGDASYNVIDKTMEGDITELTEDLRDFLRRRGIKIYNGNPFESIKPEWIKKLDG